VYLLYWYKSTNTDWVRAFKPPTDDVVSVALAGDTNGDMLLDKKEAAAYYQGPAGASAGGNCTNCEY
jgi:hypothetical protein